MADLQDAQTVLLDNLQHNIKLAWSPSIVHRDAPALEDDDDELPVAYLFIEEAVADDGVGGSFCSVMVRHRISMALRFEKIEGKSLLEQKRGWATSLRRQVGRNPYCRGLNATWVSEEYLDADPEENASEARARWALVRLSYDFWIDVEGL